MEVNKPLLGDYRKRLEVLGNFTIFENMPAFVNEFISRIVGMEKQKNAGSNPTRDKSE